MKTLIFLLLAALTLSAADFYYRNGEKVGLTPLPEKRDLSGVRYFRQANGAVVGVGTDLLVKTKPDTDLAPLLEKHGVQLVRNLGRDLYLLRTEGDALAVSNAFHEEEGVLFAHPDFRMERRLR